MIRNPVFTNEFIQKVCQKFVFWADRDFILKNLNNYSGDNRIRMFLRGTELIPSLKASCFSAYSGIGIAREMGL